MSRSMSFAYSADGSPSTRPHERVDFPSAFRRAARTCHALPLFEKGCVGHHAEAPRGKVPHLALNSRAVHDEVTRDGAACSRLPATIF